MSHVRYSIYPLCMSKEGIVFFFTHLKHHKRLPSHNLEYLLIRLQGYIIILYIFILLGSYHRVKNDFCLLKYHYYTQLYTIIVYTIKLFDVLHLSMNIIKTKR